jgi:hypothetical protein
MKSKLIILLGTVAVLGSCTSAYRIGQTPDDVYYSPAPAPQAAYVTSDNQQDRDGYGYNNSNGDISENLAIRRCINSPVYRSSIALDYDYGYDPYNYYGSSFYYPNSSYYGSYNSSLLTFYPYNSYYSNFYSPYYNYYYPQAYYINKPGNASSNYNIAPRRYNLGAYKSNDNVPRNYRAAPNTTTNSAPVRTFAPPASDRTGYENSTRRIYTPVNNDNNRSYNNTNNTNNNYTPPERTFTPATTSGSSSSSSPGNSGGGSAPVRTFGR